jgi:hypothetical protein
VSDRGAWYRSSDPAPCVPRTFKRAARDVLLSWLPVPDVKGATVVVHSRRTFPVMTWRGLRSEYHGFFSEFQSVLGALAFAEAGGAAAVRVDFESPLYVDRNRGPNWWTYYFRDQVMPVGAPGSATHDVELDGVVTKYGRYGGFADLVQGKTPYLYPGTFGISRVELHRLATAFVSPRSEILEEVARFTSAEFHPGAFVVGLHYRGTDATAAQRWKGRLTHYRTAPVPYRTYADEVRRVIEQAAPPEFQVFVATDESDCFEFMRREFGDRVIGVGDAPRVRSGGQAVHLDRTLAVSGYQKGKSALVDSLLLSSTDYLVKGRSNLSDASLVFSPSLPYSFLPDVALPRAAA